MNARAAGAAAPLLAVLLAASGVAGCAGSSPKPDQAAGRKAHPEVPASGVDTCASCHARTTPDVHAAWNGGPHGPTLVGCVVCHGSTGPDFHLRPASAACDACHPAAAASAGAPAGGVRDCFSCHPPQALLPAKGERPHGAAARGGRP